MTTSVPFAHLALHAAKLPRAAAVTMASGGHQFGDDLQAVAADLRAGDGVQRAAAS